MAPGTSRFTLDNQGNRTNINNNNSNGQSDSVVCYAKVEFTYFNAKNFIWLI